MIDRAGISEASNGLEPLTPPYHPRQTARSGDVGGTAVFASCLKAEAAPPPKARQLRRSESVVLALAQPVLCAAQVPMVAKSATATADGTLELVPPGVVEVMFGPNIASNSTASHITVRTRRSPCCR